MAENKPIIFDTSDGQELRINMISPWLKRYFGRQEDRGKNQDGSDERTLKIIKLSIDGGFTCPNRDGRKGTGGCMFCSESGSGDMASSASESSSAGSAAENIRKALMSQMNLLSDKWPEEKYRLKYIAYFQSHTNTYAPTEKLREMFEAALAVDGVCGLAIATRSDCISDETLELLDELNRKTFLWIELGLQTIHHSTAKAMNLCHTVEDYDEAAEKLMSRNIRVVTHLILGLPEETREMMLESVQHACRSAEPDGSGITGRIFGLKLHMLNVVKGSGMEKEYSDYVPFETMKDYIDLLIEALEMVPPEITMHRISGDAPRSILIAPEWSYRKRTILNSIHRRMKELNTWQGRRTGMR